MKSSHRAFAASLITFTALAAVPGGAGAAVVVGTDGPDTSLPGTAGNDTVYGEPLAGMGPVTAIKRVSTASPVSGVEAQTEGGANSYAPRFSADGMKMVFVSDSKTLVPGVVELDSVPDVTFWSAGRVVTSSASSRSPIARRKRPITLRTSAHPAATGSISAPSTPIRRG